MSAPPPNTQLLVSGSGAVYMQNLAVQGNSIIATNTDGSVNFVPNGNGVIGFGDVGFNSGVISTTVTDLDIVLAPNGNGNVGVGTTSPGTKLQVDGYQTFYDTSLLVGYNTTGDKVPAKIIFGNQYCPQIRTFYPDQGHTDQIDLEFWTSGQNIPTDNMSSRLTIKAQSGNVGIGTSSPAAKLDVSGLIKTDHLSLGIQQYPNVGGQWLTINLNTYNANAGPNAPDPEGGIMFSNIDGNSIFKWGYYMGVVKPSASDQGNSQRLDIGRTNDVESQISGGTTAPAGTFIPSVTVFNDKVGIGTTSPAAKLDIGGNTDGQVQAILTRGLDINFQLQAINESSSSSSGDVVSKFGLRYRTDETVLFNFIRGSSRADGSLAIVTNNTERMRVDSGGNVGIGTTDPLGTLDVNGVLHLRSGTTGYSVGASIDTTNKTNTYISFGESGTENDWCYLRQIGGSNNYQLAFDFHDDGTDAGFFIRDVKSTDTPDTITTRFCVTGGNVGIGASSPRTRFQVNSPADLFYINSTSGQSVEIYGSASDVSPSYTPSSDHSATVMINSTDAYSQNVGASISLGGRSYPWGGSSQPHTVYARMSGVQQPGTNSYHGNFVVETLYQNTGGLREALRIDGNGNVGIGTSSPYARLHVNGTGNTSTELQTGNRRYFGYNTGTFVADTNVVGDPANTISIYAINRIVTGSYIVSHSNTTFSDRRIKKDIVDVEDDTCLQKLRLIKPKQYTYQDTIAKGTTPVWGFIAQEVAETLDYAVEKMKKAIPNVYKLASVSVDGFVLTFEEPITLETMDTIKLQLKTLVSEEHNVTVLVVLSPTTIRLTEPLTEEHHTGTLGDESIVRKVFVYGQWVDDFHVLKKDAIFTVAVAALQEVDRRQTMDNERILELEGELALVKEENNLLKQKLDSILGRLSAAGL